MTLLDQGSFEVTLHLFSHALDVPLMTNYKEHRGITLIFDYAERSQLDYDRLCCTWRA